MKTRVLVVDDDRLVADTLSMIYIANGYDCEARYSAADAFARAKEFAPDLVLCDVTLPDESGLQLGWRVQDALPHTRLLLLTAYASNAVQVSAEAHRMHRPVRLLNKPCRPDDLLRETASLLQSA